MKFNFIDFSHKKSRKVGEALAWVVAIAVAISMLLSSHSKAETVATPDPTQPAIQTETVH